MILSDGFAIINSFEEGVAMVDAVVTVAETVDAFAEVDAAVEVVEDTIGGETCFNFGPRFAGTFFAFGDSSFCELGLEPGLEPGLAVFEDAEVELIRC